MNNSKELIIIGGGIAGVSAAVYAKRLGLDFDIFESKAVGGQLLFMENIDNYIGIGLGAKGRDLAETLQKTLADLEIQLTTREIIRAEIEGNILNLETAEGLVKTRAAIVATGANFRKLGIKGEEELSGKGVSYCAVCDGFFFRDKSIAVVGGGNTAVEEALYLSGIVQKVTLIHRGDKLRALDYLQKEIFKKDNIEVLFNHTVKEIKGSKFVEELTLEDVKTSHEKLLKLQGIFVAIGIKPNTEVFKSLVSCDESRFIITDEEMKTSCPFIWAAGDCRKRPLRQLITAASEGAIAAVSSYKYLRGHYISA